MTGPVARSLSALFLAAATLSAAARQPEDLKKAKAYVAEVRKHLLESYVEREKLSGEKLDKAGLAGLAAAMDHRDYAALDEKTRVRIRGSVREARSVEAALDAVSIVVDDGFDFLKFADHAARAMVRETGDPYSRILTSDEFNKLLKLMQGGGREESPGLAVQAADGAVAYVQYGYPAYEEGIEIGDVVVEIDGKPVAGRAQEEINESLKLRPGTPLAVKIRRPGHAEPYVFRLEARASPVKDVRTEYLGEGIGYLRMTIFDLKLSSEVRKGLEDLKRRGMKKLILDLRHNPGGALPAATAVADLLLPQGLVITTTESNYKPNLFGIEIPGVGGDQEYKTKVRTDFEEMPLVVLIDRASASASELLAGALQDHRRGKLIGRTTYGKGVGQAPIFLTSVFQKRYLYLTVMTYKLPSGRSIHHKGVVPDIDFAEEKPSPETFARIRSLREGGRVAKYVDAAWGGHAGALRRLAKNDGFEWGRYPGFDALYESLETRLSKDEVRAEVRRAVRRRMERTENVVWTSDLETDAQLQRALVELLD
ncbi:MAG: PDZ domain-containing protein [Planctomycetes bacterium]|nr:PDZ domain-containing protein [Planctomycetota bacterium]